VHDAPSFLQVAPAPPHTPPWQSLLQHWPFDVHESPLAEQLGVAHVPPTQLPLQQSLDDWQLSPEGVHAAPDGEVPLGAMQTPEQARLQQSDHEAHVAPTAAHAPPAPPSADSHASVAGAPAQPMKIATSVPRVIDVERFMAGPFRNPRAVRRARPFAGDSAGYRARAHVAGGPSAPPDGSARAAATPKVSAESDRRTGTVTAPPRALSRISRARRRFRRLRAPERTRVDRRSFVARGWSAA
jgi:hypothetical protein